VFKIINHQVNANQNYIEIPSHPNMNGNHQENKQEEMLKRMQRKWNPFTLLVEK
jgi:hypothetical protein